MTIFPTPVYARAQTSSAVPPLIVQFTATEPAFGANMEEDIAIMTRLFERSLDQMGEVPPTSKLGIRFMLTGDNRSVRASYLEGFGALFLIKVNFPVLGTTRPAETKQAPAADSDWEKAKRDLVGGPSGLARNLDTVESAEYDPNLLARLTESLLATLKNATNIRGLKPEEFIAVAVFGTSSGPTRGAQRFPRFGGGGFSTPENPAIEPSARSFVDGRGTVLTLRAKRSDVDTFAKDELSFEAFRARVSTHAYAGNGYGITSLNSWVHDGASNTISEPRRR
jgi:hypothetical protein